MKILIVKLGALGDVLRTTPILEGFRRKYPGCVLDWVVDRKHRGVLENNEYIHALYDYSDKTLKMLSDGAEYDLVLNLDKDEEALHVMTQARAKKKMGFVRSASGGLKAADALSEYAYRLGIDDELKFRQNKKTYQEISFEQAGLKFQGERYLFHIPAEDEKAALAYLETLGVVPSRLKHPVIGLNTGSGARFAGKKLPVEHYVKLAQLLSDKLHATVFLLGGEDEIVRNREIASLAKCPTINTGHHPIFRFAAIVKLCDLVITGDTTAMHIAIATDRPCLVYFGSTCAAEIELYGRGAKIVSQESCAPCYKRECPYGEICMKKMDPEGLFVEAKKLLGGVK